ncbi:PREDICTED: sodium-dependent lysophosphatidylcholine symporter 1-A-like [Tinamus guttatus]|uniref:sodium-dependent lysophosphatidylcholine symporter 1-A-like n=1 Tax=Tinamus guttatus TaxID=94827 RepID=UPI00052ED642|nr:PREDICTED: sodium-dependent lysophosphatidylcholine symporter 1-A-like [Tinamus guttatus]
MALMVSRGGGWPYVQLLCGFLCASLAFQIAQGIFATFCTHAAGLAGKFQHLLLVMLVSAALSIPFWQWLLGKFGKKTAVSLGLLLIIPALVAITQVTHNFLAFIFLMMVAGCSMAVLYLLPWSMLPDAVDDFRLRNPSCLNLEALFYSFYVFFNKFAGGLAVGISTLSLHFAGYRAGDCRRSPSVTLALQLLMAPVPISLLLAAVAIFCTYPITEERREQMRREMEAIGARGAVGAAALATALTDARVAPSAGSAQSPAAPCETGPAAGVRGSERALLRELPSPGWAPWLLHRADPGSCGDGTAPTSERGSPTRRATEMPLRRVALRAC